MKLPRGLKLFIADIQNEENYEQEIWYVVGKTYDSAFKRFTKEANSIWHTYLYYFNEANEEQIERFVEELGDEVVEACIYYT
jgi:hypothetical protein